VLKADSCTAEAAPYSSSGKAFRTRTAALQMLLERWRKPSFAHAAVMAVMAVHLPNERVGLLGAGAVFSSIGVALIALAPAKPSVERVSVAVL
jgi:hypothetical protein